MRTFLTLTAALAFTAAACGAATAAHDTVLDDPGVTSATVVDAIHNGTVAAPCNLIFGEGDELAADLGFDTLSKGDRTAVAVVNGRPAGVKFDHPNLDGIQGQCVHTIIHATVVLFDPAADNPCRTPNCTLDSGYVPLVGDDAAGWGIWIQPDRTQPIPAAASRRWADRIEGWK